jgi:hypothetical protein
MSETLSDGVLELLFRYELGDFPEHVRARLDEIFRTNPEDAVERLERAAAFLNLEVLTPRTLERVDADLDKRSRTQEPEKRSVLSR